jgi:glycosyltransferase involved in cell wall biosynthesis
VIVDAVVPARNEAPTVADVVEACLGCAYVREVIVIDDGSTDDTAERAAAAGAKVIRRESDGSKAHAMETGVEATDADSILFVDADCVGLTSEHLEAICRPFVERRAVMSLGTFDYGLWNWFVLRFPPTTGERIIPRWVFDAVHPDKREGYTIELMLNAVIGEGRLPTTARVMRGVTHRTKRDKFGPVEGWQRTWRMFWDLVGVLRQIRVRAYWFYLRDLTIER